MQPILTNDTIGQAFLEQLKPYPCYGGLDLASVNDLTAFVLVWPIKGKVYVYPWFFIPGDGLAARSKRDGVPYDLWSQQGLIELTEGSVTDWRYVTARLKTLAKVFNIKEVGFDSWGARDTVADLMEAGINTVDVSQAIGSISAPTKRLQELILSKQLVHTGHAILRWNLDCTTIYSDLNSNIKPIKPPIGKSSKRIDGVVALVMAISRLQKAPTPAPKSVYSTRGLLTL